MQPLNLSPLFTGRVLPSSNSGQLFRRFLDTPARVTIAEEAITVHLPRRAHNPILLDTGLIGAPSAIPWWGGRPLRIEIV